MNRKQYIFVAGALALISSACTGNYENINSDPYQPKELIADDYALGSSMNNLSGCVISSDVNTAQFTDCLLGGPMGGYYADSNQGWTSTIAHYNPQDNWSRVFLKTDRIIPVLYSNYATIEVTSRNTGNEVPLAIAKILKVACMHRVTDTFGPIPYTKIGADGNLTTPYDPVDVVYKAFFTELDEALKVLNENSNARLTASADFIYGGDIKKWIKYANSLKLRLAIRMANADPELSRSMAEQAVNQENGGVIESNEENASWDYFATVENPIYVATRYNSNGAATGGDTHAAADIICYMNGYNDPRRPKYFVKSEWPGYEYVGMRRGIVIPDLKTEGYKYSGVNIAPTSPLMWLNAAEVAFLKAEAVAVYGYNMGGTAEEFYNQGIRLSFEQWGVSGADAYLNDETSLPGTYVDPSGKNSYTQTLSTITIKWDDAATVEQKQERIIVQKWIANWQLGNEAWADYRRTGFPHLIPVKENKSGGVVSSERGARRMPYPLDEYNNNAENVKEAVAKYLNGPDNMATDLIWAKKN